MVIVAVLKKGVVEKVVGVAQYGIDQVSHTAEAAFVVKDDYQNQGIGTALVTRLTFLAKSAGLLGFTAEVLFENKGMLHLFRKIFPNLKRNLMDGVYELRMPFE